MRRLIKVLKKHGIIGTFIKICNKLSFKIFKVFNNLDIRYEKKRSIKLKQKLKVKYDFIESKCRDKKYKHVFVFYPYTEWNLPIFQRPQQIALALSKRKDCLYLFCSTNNRYDSIEGLYQKINDNLYVINDYEFVSNLEINNRVIHLYSTDVTTDINVVKQAKARNDKVLYEYIDEIHEEITHSLPKYYLQKHEEILKDESCYVVVTADKLYDDVKKYRKTNFVLATNGVNVDDFKSSNEIPEDLKEIREKYKKIILYYGALAVWFDYDLIKKISKKYKNYAIVLLGMEYDSSYKNSKIEELSNVYYLGKKPYNELYKYAQQSDLLTIPFVINEITESTSPVKLFEYMAIKKPILTTDMKECRKYKSVIIGVDHKDFINKIDTTIDLINDKKYLTLEEKEALDNTWTSKSEKILDLLKNKQHREK